VFANIRSIFPLDTNVRS